MQPPILITGAARSGTSLIAGAINICGAKGGTMMQVPAANPQGMFENKEVTDQCIKPWLEFHNADRKCQYPLPDPDSQDQKSGALWRQQIQEIMERQGVGPEDPWFIKSPKITWTWRLWAQAFPGADWVIVRRRREDVARSCCHVSFMREMQNPNVQGALRVSSEHDGWLWWVDQHVRVFEQIKRELSAWEIWPENMINGDYRALYSLIHHLGLQWTSQVLTFIDPKLWKARKSRN